MSGSDETCWVRDHVNGWRGIVIEHTDGAFSAGSIQQFGSIAHKGIRSLDQAKARADGDVQEKAPHSCETCQPWS